MDDNAIDETVDGSSITYEAKLNINVLNKAKNEIENNVMITNHPVIGGRRHDCNSILFAKR
jgi:beta-lactam-binding protein with PASTA domain